ncbi:hypothetical protein EKA14_10280 [Bacillus mycoides]|nr:hypothetical protein EKA14_10280 [Bacillus mycoides]
MQVRINVVEDEDEMLFYSNLETVPGTGDIVEGHASSGEKYKVESVIHQNIFNSAGEHIITINLTKL